MSYIALGSDDQLFKYIKRIESFPMLEPQEEMELIFSWYNDGNVDAAQKIVVSYMRLVVKLAFKFKNYGFALMDLISEGNIGLMKAVKNFNPTLGYKIATYAIWWIKSSIQEYILKSWSLVKIGTTAAQRKLFFNLRKMKNKISSVNDKISNYEVMKDISSQLNIPYREVVEMDNLLTNKDLSLSTPINEDETLCWGDIAQCPNSTHDAIYEDNEDLALRKKLLLEAIANLKPRHKDIFMRRRLKNKPETLDVISKEYGISIERIRQIDEDAWNKVKKYITLRMFDANKNFSKIQ